jgi:hypothetical protein
MKIFIPKSRFDIKVNIIIHGTFQKVTYMISESNLKNHKYVVLEGRLYTIFSSNSYKKAKNWLNKYIKKQLILTNSILREYIKDNELLYNEIDKQID